MTAIQSAEPNQTKKRKVKDLSLEEKRAFLHKKYEECMAMHPEVDELFERMKLTEEDLKDEKTRYILGSFPTPPQTIPIEGFDCMVLPLIAGQNYRPKPLS